MRSCIAMGGESGGRGPPLLGVMGDHSAARVPGLGPKEYGLQCSPVALMEDFIIASRALVKGVTKPSPRLVRTG